MNNINPKWKPLLDVMPESLHSIMIPHLTEWDKGVSEEFQKRAEELKKYEAYKPFVEQNIDPSYVMSSVQLADAIKEDPAAIAARMNVTYNLGYISKEEAEQLKATPNPDDLGLEDEATNMNIQDHPEFKAMQQVVEQLKGTVDSRTQAEQDAQQEREWNEYLDKLEKDSTGPFNRTLVSAYLIADENMSGEDAVKAYQTELAKQFTPEQLKMIEENQQATGQQQTDLTNQDGTAPPVVLDGSPAGSGLASEAVDWGKLSKDQTNDYVEKLLESSAQSGQ